MVVSDFTEWKKRGELMVLLFILDGNSEKGAYMWSNLDYFIRVRQSSHKSDILSPKRLFFLHAFVVCSDLPSNIITMASYNGKAR